VVGIYDGLVAMDLLYKMLHTTRPYELVEGTSDALFEEYAQKLLELLQNLHFKIPQLLTGRYLRPLEKLLAEAAREFQKLKKSGERRPLILLGGEFYVRLDDRCNRELIRKIESEGGEVSLAPASELFSYTAYINYREACTAFQFNKSLSKYLQKVGLGVVTRLARRNEHRLERAARGILPDQGEPSPKEIMQAAHRYVSKHYGGEPPMTIGRACSFAGRKNVAGIVFVAPFTCMPGSVVESQMGALREELDLPMVTVYYDGKENANRDEFIESLVFQAKQRLEMGSASK
jgi:predicted nucleotide-binding protein (sugar kinase/HSP70/actin superfamily)